MTRTTWSLSLCLFCLNHPGIICVSEVLRILGVFKAQWEWFNLPGFGVGKPRFLCPRHCFVQILRRGMPPSGGGEVLFSCPVRKVLKPVQLTDPGKIKRIRGMAYPLSWILSLFLPRGVNKSTCFHYLHLRQQSHKSWGSRTMKWPLVWRILGRLESALCSVVKCFFCVLWGKITLCTSVNSHPALQIRETVGI